MIGRPLVMLAVLSLSLLPLEAGEQAHCSLTPRECERHIREMLAGKKVLGVRFTELTGGGLVVKTVTPASPAGRAGLYTGDRILSINGIDCRKADIATFKEVLGVAQKQGRFSLAVIRSGRIQVAQLRVRDMQGKEIDKIVETHIRTRHVARDQ